MGWRLPQVTLAQAAVWLRQRRATDLAATVCLLDAHVAWDMADVVWPYAVFVRWQRGKPFGKPVLVNAWFAFETPRALSHASLLLAERWSDRERERKRARPTEIHFFTSLHSPPLTIGGEERECDEDIHGSSLYLSLPGFMS